MLGRDGYRIAEAQTIGLLDIVGSAAAFGLVGEQNDGLALAAHERGEMAVDGRDPVAGIDHEQAEIGLIDRRFRLPVHATGEACGGSFIEARRVDQGEIETAERSFAQAAVARDARTIVDERQFPADQSIEQGRLADIRPADNGDLQRHAGTYYLMAMRSPS